ncbi:hypothetical protein [Niabella drilacis]|uniref:Uncharacterized protein n=1 Tax=Niabella drilacis (strain DSM 25811 / CCM 8410 / CCUG 62505 / LMG 26954 / E90) TaxID=1285928 RepID=A0A1G6LGB5_NIADE|nr:hypothetical protein [Niabella drilacis]SDC42472.1 hypothetical protein SAMN04487894_102345 [Niabella drilacis]
MKCGSWHFTDFRKGGGIALQMRRVVVYMHALMGQGDRGGRAGDAMDRAEGAPPLRSRFWLPE